MGRAEHRNMGLDYIKSMFLGCVGTGEHGHASEFPGFLLCLYQDQHQTEELYKSSFPALWFQQKSLFVGFWLNAGAPAVFRCL